jgi:hypothetical protein
MSERSFLNYLHTHPLLAGAQKNPRAGSEGTHRVPGCGGSRRRMSERSFVNYLHTDPLLAGAQKVRTQAPKELIEFLDEGETGGE